MECGVVEQSPLVSAVSGAEAGQTDQPLDPCLFHRGDEDARCLRKQPHRLEDHLRTGGNAKRLNDRVHTGERLRHCASIQRITRNLLQIGMADGDPTRRTRQRAHLVTCLQGASQRFQTNSPARTDNQDSRHGIIPFRQLIQELTSVSLMRHL